MQWSAWLRRTRRLPPTLEELQQDVIRQQRLQQEVAKLQAAYEAEKAAALAEAEKVAQLDAPRRKPATASSTSQSQAQTERQRTPYPSHDNPAIVPDSTAATGHPPSQEFGANVPKAKPKEGVFPGMAEDSPERHQMAAALDEAADINLGKSEKERQIKQGKVEQGECEMTTRSSEACAHTCSFVCRLRQAMRWRAEYLTASCVPHSIVHAFSTSRQGVQASS